MKFEVQLESEGDSQLFEDLQRYLKYHPALTRFLFSPAGLTFIVGTFLFVGLVLGLSAVFLIDPPVAAQMLATLTIEIFPGKEFATAAGLTFGLHPVVVFGIVFLQDLITTSWVYPLFYVFRKHHIHRENFWGYFFRKAESDAKDHEGWVKKWGAWGIFLFMLIPFAVNGPLIGAIIGKLAGIRTRYVLPAVVGATALTTAYWTLLWYYFQDMMEAIVAGPYGTWVHAGFTALILFIIAWIYFDYRKDRRELRNAAERRRAEAERRQFAETLQAEESRTSDPEARAEATNLE